MKRLLTLALAAALAVPVAALAQGGNTYSETTVLVPATTWTLVIARDPLALRRQVILSDATGAGCAWSMNATPVTGEGVGFSTTSAAGSYVFDPPVPLNALYVRCTNAATITVASN